MTRTVTVPLPLFKKSWQDSVKQYDDYAEAKCDNCGGIITIELYD